MKLYILVYFIFNLVVSLFCSDSSNFFKQEFSTSVEKVAYEPQIAIIEQSEDDQPVSKNSTISESVITEPEIHKSEIQVPETEDSKIEEPEIEEPEIEEFEIEEPEIEEPEIEEPEIEEPVEIIPDNTITENEISLEPPITDIQQIAASTDIISTVSSKEATDSPRSFEDLAPTSIMSFEEIVGDNGLYEIPSYMPEPGTYRIIVDLKYQVVMVYEKDNNGEYTVPVRYMICSTGADATQTPTGIFAMKDYRVRYAIFRNTDVYAQYWSLITGRIYFHSLLYSDRDASTYTKSSYNNLGHNVSHGCIRLTVPDARWIWYNIAPGTEVEVRKGSSKDIATKEIKEKLTLPKLPDKRITLTPGNIPYTDNWQIENVPQEYKFINGHQ